MDLISYIAVIEKVLNKQAKKKFLASSLEISRKRGRYYQVGQSNWPFIRNAIDVGIKNFVEWYHEKDEVKSS